MNDYERIAEAISYIKTNFTEQPSLEAIAAHLHLSPFHFQRLFQNWAGVSPKKFLQYVSVQHAKTLLADKQSIATATYDTGLSGTSRLHDLFVNIEGMTPGEYKNGGADLVLHYSVTTSIFGNLLIASSNKGITNILFLEESETGSDILQQMWPKAIIVPEKEDYPQHASVARLFSQTDDDPLQIKLHLKGTPFQLKVWEALLKIPVGKLTTYADIAHVVGNDKASRAVGTAIGSNPVAYIIPCHRVIRATGIIGDYRWGNTRKTAIIGWESSHKYGNTETV